MWEALPAWRAWPRQIASDLRCRGLHIKWWLRGTVGGDGDPLLSSYELMEIIEHLPEESATKTAMRRGGWTTLQAMVAQTFNETARFRASFHGRCGSGYEPPEMTDPAVLLAQREADAAHALDREEVEGELFRAF